MQSKFRRIHPSSLHTERSILKEVGDCFDKEYYSRKDFKMKKNQVCVIVGPTASGKTALSIEIAQQLGGEIINGDAMQVYRKMDVGTAKIMSEEMCGIPHHLFSIIQADEEYSIFEHQKNVRAKIAEITERGNIPIIVGGSGLYIQAVLYDYQLGQEEIVEEDDLQISNASLWQQLFEIDNIAAEKIHPNNRKRVFRALIRARSGETKTESEAKSENQTLLYDVFAIGMHIDREVLSQRIEQRVDMMLQLGLEQEVKELFNKPVSDTAKVAIGYREWIPYFEGKASLAEVREQIIIHTRQLSKKQMTWFRNQRLPILWIENSLTHKQILARLTEWKK